MGDLLGGLIALVVWLLLLPLILLIVVFALAMAGIGIAVGLAAWLLGTMIHLFFWALPLLIVLGLVWLVFGGRKGQGREVVRG